MTHKPVPAFNYDFLTPFYDLMVNLLGYGASQRVKVVNLLNLQPGERLLDIGCGTGTLLLIAKKNYPDIQMEGVDIDKKVLAIAERKFKKESLNLKLTKASADKLPFKNSSFDTVVSTLIFHHLPTEVKIGALKEIYRVLKPNGRFLLADFGKAAGIFKLLFFLEKLFKIPEAKTAEDNVEGRIPQLLKDSGFKINIIAPRYRGIDFILTHK